MNVKIPIMIILADMKNIVLLSSLCCLAAAAGSSCHTQNGQSKTPDKDSAIGRVELYDSSAAGIIDSQAVIGIIGKNYKWSEGPVWVPAKQMLLFSAVRENKIYRWNG